MPLIPVTPFKYGVTFSIEINENNPYLLCISEKKKFPLLSEVGASVKPFWFETNSQFSLGINNCDNGMSWGNPKFTRKIPVKVVINCFILDPFKFSGQPKANEEPLVKECRHGVSCVYLVRKRTCSPSS